MKMHDRPLVSFIVKTYNQERYVDSVLQGAFAQTYRPIEIVVSDDGSTDGSVTRIRQAVAGAGFVEPVSVETRDGAEIERYGTGDRTVVLVLNARNRGNCGNWCFACSVARGELFVKADGDDISLPERTERIVAEWRKAGPSCGVLYHNAIMIDENGREIGTADKEIFTIKHTLGAVMACTRECIDVFGDCVNPRAADDVVFHRRALSLGYTETRFDEKLVRYRIGSGVSTRGKSYVKTLHQNIQISACSLECTLADLSYLKNARPDLDLTRECLHYEREYRRRLAEFPMWESDRFFERWRSFRITHPRIKISLAFVVHFILLLPRPVAHAILDMLYRIR
jgi:glycosyltransferase involved in cell wall biosynthesis